jgi:hypothetical protein
MPAEQGGSVRFFISDDDAYLQWLEANPSGFVVNSYKIPKAGYLKLHRATCSHLRTEERSNWTNGNYIKTCSDNPLALETWARTIADGVLDPCPACKPY